MQLKTMPDYNVLRLVPAVEASLAANRPVVALESTVLAHGLPRPLNSKTAQRLERIIADAGATPATIAILDGQILVGLTETQLPVIVESDQIKKISTRDLAVAQNLLAPPSWSCAPAQRLSWISRRRENGWKPTASRLLVINARKCLRSTLDRAD